MRLSKFIFILSLLISPHVFGADCPASDTATATGASSGENCTVVGSTSSIRLDFAAGFDTATPIAAVDGNNGTTVGAQRKLSFIKAAEILAEQVHSSQVIIIDAEFDASLFCDANGATLGSAGAASNLANVGSPPASMLKDTFYPIGLLNAMGNMDYDTSIADISSGFNPRIGTPGCLEGSGGWHYGFASPPNNYTAFTTVLLHEIAHGLGFSSLVNASTGALANGLDDIFSLKLYSAADNKSWSKADGLSDGQRAASATSATGLLWSGNEVNTHAEGALTAGFQDNDASNSFTTGDRVQMFAPNPVQGGSSVSHFDTAASPNELMEPMYTEAQYTLGLAAYLLRDIGWTITTPADNHPPIWSTIPSQTLDIGETATINLNNYASDEDGDTLTYSGCGAICSISGNTLTINTASDASENVVIEADDGNGGITDSPSFSITVKTPSILSSTFDGNTYKDGDTLNYDFNNKAITILGGSGYSYVLTYDGSDSSSLLDTSGMGVSINLPASGAFAGTYTLDITDAGNNQMSLTLVRPLRLTWSNTSLLNGDSSQTLSIEGGKAGSLYTTSQQPSTDISFLDENGHGITTFTAPDNAASFNAASGFIVGTTVTTVTTVAVTIVNSNNGYPDALQDIKLYPALTQQITVINESAQSIAEATLALTSDTIIDALNISLNYLTDAQGQVSLLLPDDNNSYILTISANGYNSKTLTVDAQQTTHQVVLTVNENTIKVSGTITALNAQNFILNKPSLNLLFGNNVSQPITVAVQTLSKATFEFKFDSTQDNPEALEVLQVDSITVNKDLTVLSYGQKFQFFLEDGSASNTPKDIVIEARSGSGYPNPLHLFLLGLFLVKGKRHWKNGNK